jgi:hypothetical protein
MPRNPDCLKYAECLNAAARKTAGYKKHKMECDKCPNLELPHEEGFNKYEHETEEIKNMADNRKREERYCKICGEKDFDKLHNNPHAYKGKDLICQKCFRARDLKAYHQRIKTAVEKTKISSTRDDQERTHTTPCIKTFERKGDPKELECAPKDQPVGRLNLDLLPWPEILKHLPDAAIRHIRSRIEDQAIAYIVAGLQADGYGKEAA